MHAGKHWRAPLTAACTMIHLGWDAKDALEAIQTARATRFRYCGTVAVGSEVQSAAVSAGQQEREAAMSAKCPNPIPDPIIDLSFPHHCKPKSWPRGR